MSSLKIAVASFAHVHAEGWTAQLAARPDVEVVVADPDDPARAAEYVERFDVTVAASYDELFAERPDGALVCTENSRHRAVVEQAAAAGAHILCEKPLATTASGCRRIVEREVAGGRRLIQLGYMRRFDPGYTAMKEELDAGRVGAALLLHCQHRNATALPWFTPEMPLLNSAVHEIDAARWLLGADVTRVSVHTPRTTRHATANMRDPRMVVLETTSGAVVDIEVFVNARYGYDVRCELVAEDATLSLTPPSRVGIRTQGTDANPVYDDFRQRFADAYRQQLVHWVASVRDGVTTGANAWDGYAASQTAEACVSAATSGQVVDLTPTETPSLYAQSSAESLTSHH